MKIILFLPIIAYIALFIFNLDSFLEIKEIDIFKFGNIYIPVLLYSIIFFIAYIFLIFFLYDIKNVFYRWKIDKLELEIISLKSKLFDKREDIFRDFVKDYNTKMDNFTKEQQVFFEKIQKENEMELLKQKHETERILDKMNLIDKWLFDRLKDSFKK